MNAAEKFQNTVNSLKKDKFKMAMFIRKWYYRLADPLIIGGLLVNPLLSGIRTRNTRASTGGCI